VPCCFLPRLPSNKYLFAFLLDCSTPQRPDHATVNYTNGHLYLDKASVNCATGYRMKWLLNNTVSQEDIECLSTGTWSVAKGCEKKGMLECTNNQFNILRLNVFNISYIIYVVTLQHSMFSLYENRRNQTVLKYPITHGCVYMLPNYVRCSDVLPKMWKKRNTFRNILGQYKKLHIIQCRMF